MAAAALRRAVAGARRPALAALAVALALRPADLAFGAGPVEATLRPPALACAARDPRLEIGARRFLPRRPALEAPCWPLAFGAIEAALARRAVA
jgi:hypothetical protein